MSNTPITLQLCDQPSEVVEYWYEKATDHLVNGAFLPFSESVWDSDKYADVIFEKAQEMFEDYHYKQVKKQ